jgi:P27 family predicted phage terminase small subunit
MKKDGPSRTPTNIKLLRGTFRGDRAVSNEAQLPDAIPPVPPHLSDEAKVEWGRITQDLYAAGLLKNVDRAALCAYCDAWSDYVDASSRVKAMGTVVTTKKVIQKDGTETGGNIIENPYYSVKKRSMELMYRFLTEFGMTPASRSRIEADPPGSAEGASRWKQFGS